MASVFQRLLVGLFIITVSLAEEAPKLTIQPERTGEILRDLNGTGFFTCSVANPQHAQQITDLHWLDPSGNIVPDERQARIHTSRSRDHTLELIFTNIHNEDGGNYTCVAQFGTAGQRVTKAFQLGVIMKIRWVDAPLVQNPVVGTDALIRCQVRANPPAAVEWERRKTPLTDRMEPQDDGLLIRDVRLDDDGTYTCRAKVTKLGELRERAIKVKVYTPPTITQPEENAEIVLTEDEEDITRCMATGKPEPTRNWVTEDGRDAADIEGITVNELDGTLRFAPARSSMAGRYRCIASNAVSSVETAVRVIVNVKPEITSYANVTSAEGSEALLECHVTGSPLPMVRFRREGSELSFEEGVSQEDPRVTVALTERDGVRIAVLAVGSVTREDGGQYVCVAQNAADLRTASARLSVHFAPSVTALSDSQVYTWPDHAANMSCAVQAVPNATVQWTFSGRVVDGATMAFSGDSAVSTLTVTPIDSEEFGVYTCEATNDMKTVSLDFQLERATEPGRLDGITVLERTATSLEFDVPPPLETGGLPVRRYLIQYVPEGQPWPAHIEVVHAAGQPYFVHDLNPEDTYQFRFAAENDVGLSQWSDSLIEKMPKIDVPQPPKINMELGDSPAAALQDAQDPPVVPSVSPDGYRLTWRAGADNGADIEHFQVSYYKVVNNKNRWRVVSDKHTSVVPASGPEDLSFRLTGLKPESFYRVELRARNRIGFSDPAQVIVHTAPGVSVAAAGGGSMDSSVLVGVVIAVLLVLIILIDLACYAVNNKGFTHMLCARGGAQKSTKLTEEAASEKEPLQTNGSEAKVVPAEPNGERDVPDVAIDKAQLDSARDSAV